MVFNNLYTGNPQFVTNIPVVVFTLPKNPYIDCGIIPQEENTHVF